MRLLSIFLITHVLIGLLAADTNEAEGQGVENAAQYTRKATLQTCSGCRLNQLTHVKEFLTEDCGRDLDQDGQSGPCDMFPELYIEFVHGKVPKVIMHEEDDDVIQLHPLERDVIINLFTSRNFVKLVVPPKEKIKKPIEIDMVTSSDHKKMRQKMKEALEKLNLDKMVANSKEEI
ncbi:hypothetical protein RFI_10697 [Reticulomyxa filosa]|uniref:Uncharacterized protein n=1 Tax=Reticulomyxa filosa TaxID=46433 RepID=X6NJG8_RETFI|nr:hypothetical protein RFI_10697 [Reticulomyxa filosa]|eukprot:ETO26440.1 hypothetical protein RFI_10697 [Reticulomyxa filosa]